MDGATDGGTDGTIIEGGAGGGSLETLLILDLDKCLNMLSGDFLILFWLLHLDDEVDDADDIPKTLKIVVMDWFLIFCVRHNSSGAPSAIFSWEIYAVIR